MAIGLLYECKSTKSSNQLLNKIISEAARRLVELSRFCERALSSGQS